MPGGDALWLSSRVLNGPIWLRFARLSFEAVDCSRSGSSSALCRTCSSAAAFKPFPRGFACPPAPLLAFSLFARCLLARAAGFSFEPPLLCCYRRRRRVRPLTLLPSIARSHALRKPQRTGRFEWSGARRLKCSELATQPLSRPASVVAKVAVTWQPRLSCSPRGYPRPSPIPHSHADGHCPRPHRHLLLPHERDALSESSPRSKVSPYPSEEEAATGAARHNRCEIEGREKWKGATHSSSRCY